MNSTQVDLGLDKLRISSHPNMGSSTSSMGTVSTDLESSISESNFNTSMDFDRHTSSQRSQKFRVDDSENWEDSFAMDDGQPLPEQRPPQLQTGLETVSEPAEAEEELLDTTASPKGSQKIAE